MQILDYHLLENLFQSWLNMQQQRRGQRLDASLRSVLPRLMFRFEDFVRKTIDRFADEFNREMGLIKESISKELVNNTTLSDEERKMGNLIGCSVSRSKINSLC